MQDIEAAVAETRDDAASWNGAGESQQSSGDLAAAIRCFEHALGFDDSYVAARDNLVAALVADGRLEACRTVMRDALSRGRSGYEWATDAIQHALERCEYELAGQLARLLAEIRWVSRWYPEPVAHLAPNEVPPRRLLTADKLRHDARQFEYLRAHGELPFDWSEYRQQYAGIADRLEAQNIRDPIELSADDDGAIGAVYNRLVHLRPTPRVPRVLSPSWDAQDIELAYARRKPGVVVVDDFLTEDALAEIRAFCLESTVWNTNRYAHGRLGAFLHDGFNCPLLLQVGEELHRTLPSVILPEYPLRQVWGFKSTRDLPAGTTLHADFAAVNVNFWITPESANLDAESGGMEIYDVNAPLWWDFVSYNGRADLIRRLIDDRRARVISIPYRCNRAVIFNSDLFHATQQVSFSTRYEDHRINVTLLFGDREQDRHFPQNRDPATSLVSQGAKRAWQSAAFTPRRRG
jgi:hypothetical protein